MHCSRLLVIVGWCCLVFGGTRLKIADPLYAEDGTCEALIVHVVGTRCQMFRDRDVPAMAIHVQGLKAMAINQRESSAAAIARGS